MKAREQPSLQGALTPEQFRRMFCLSPELYRALKRCRLAPREVRIGERSLITLECIAQWRCEIEPLRQLAQRHLSRRSVPTGALTEC
jgi:hypothetical protein